MPPFIFITGYDEAIVPEEFHAVARLQKPIELRRLVNTISKLLKPDSQ